MTKVTLFQVGQKYRLKNELGGFLRQMGPRKLSKDHAEYRAAVLNGEKPYDYPNDPTSPSATSAAQASIDNYIATQQSNIATSQGKIDAANATIEEQNAVITAAEAVVAEQQAILDNPESTEEEKAAASAAIAEQEAVITAAEKKITSAEKTITTETGKIATAESNIENAADKAPAAVINEIPETLVLDNTPKKGWTVEGDYSVNEVTTVEANEKVEGGITLKNTGDPANLVINVGNSDVTLSTNTNWNEVVVESVGNNSLTVATHTHINKLILKKGHVKINNALVEDCIDEVEIKGGVLEANPAITASKVGDLYSNKPSVVTINTDLTANKNITTGILTSGHYVYHNNAVIKTNGTGSGASGYLIRGSKLLMDFYGSGEWRSLSNPTIWLSDFDGKVRIYDGKFFNEGNHAECIYAEKGFVEIYGGEFHNTETEEKNFLLNCLDANYKAGTAGITVYGGKFYGFDPAHNAAESSDDTTNFVAEGYESIYNEEGGYYEVVPVNSEGE